ncbi:MAG: pyridoxamine 5'-phosphate oxidase family protein [Spirochaetaceae bacterium]
MSEYEKCLEVMIQLFKKDFMFSFATAKDNIPSVRIVDTYYYDGAFWIVTYSKSNKVKELESNANAALCKNLYTFKGKAFNVGHPLEEKNSEIREKLIKVYESWYFLHNNEKDKNMCYVKFVPETGFFYKNGTGYKANFINKEVECFPFEPHVEGLD